MPHKHSRRERDPSTFDLPPSQIAKPLPVSAPSKPTPKNGRPAKSKPEATAPKATKRKRGGDDLKDDAPRAFKRLMAFAGGKRPRSGLDDGAHVAKKKKNNKASDPTAAPTDQVAEHAPVSNRAPVEIPTIKPGEKLSEFARRVNAALPISGLANKTTKHGKDPLGLKVWRTNKERKMHKLYDEWREEERKIQDRRAEEAELAEERAAEEAELGVKWQAEEQDPEDGGGGGDGASSGGGGGRKKRNKGGKKARLLGEVAAREEDPWLELKKKRGEARIGLHDVAQAPPELSKKTGKLLTVRGAAVEVDGIPKAAGSLRRREELQGVRNELVASYRKMMSEKKLAS